MKAHVIGYLCTSKSWGGLEMNQLKNAKWMKKRGHNVLLFAQENSPIWSAAISENIDVIHVNQHRKYYDFIKAIQLKKKIKKQGVTHLIVRDPKDMSLAGLTKSLLKNKLFLAYFMEMQLGIPKRDFLHTIRFKKFDLWSCPLPWLAEQVKELTNFPKERIHIVPSGLEIDEFKDLLSKEKARKLLDLPEKLTLFGLIGRFDKQKGQKLLLDAYLKLPNAPVGLVFLGEKTKGEATDYYTDLIKIIEENKLQNKVFIHPFRKDISPFYAAIDCLVMASKSETFGMVTIEAMACGVPVIGSNAGGTTEILENGKLGLLFAPEDEKDLSEKLKLFLKSENSSSEQLKKAVRKYDFTFVCKKIEQLLGLN